MLQHAESIIQKLILRYIIHSFTSNVQIDIFIVKMIFKELIGNYLICVKKLIP